MSDTPEATRSLSRAQGIPALSVTASSSRSAGNSSVTTCGNLCLFRDRAVPLHLRAAGAFQLVLCIPSSSFCIPPEGKSSYNLTFILPLLGEESLKATYSFLNQIQTPPPCCQTLVELAPADTSICAPCSAQRTSSAPLPTPLLCQDTLLPACLF